MKKKIRTLYVTRTNLRRVSIKWGTSVALIMMPSFREHYYVTCHKDGSVNWDANIHIWASKELIERNNVKIIANEKV